jgi:outer membrane protein OmpA-like peptidoglycan-associated protein
MQRDRLGVNIWVSIADLFLGLTVFLVAGMLIVSGQFARAREDLANANRELQILKGGQSPEEVRFSRELVRAMNLATQVTLVLRRNLERRLPSVSPRPVYRETEIIIPSGALFRSFSYDDFITDSSKAHLLTTIGAALKEALDTAGDRRRFLKVVIEGHTDSAQIRPNAITKAIPTNWELSSRRATGVLRFFESLGMSTEKYRMVAVGLADSQPIATNETASGKAQNRRIVIRVEPSIEAIMNYVRK